MALLVSIIIVFLILMIPVSRYKNSEFLTNNIEIELIKESESPNIQLPDEKINKQPTNQPNAKEISQKEPINKPVVEKQTKQVKPEVIKVPTPITPEVVEQNTQTPNDDQAPNLPSSTVIFNSAYGKVKLYELDEEFKASTGNEDDFKFKEIKQPEWNTVTKLIDEEIDKPRVEMKFYSAGIVGATEKFFDKISYKKVFTTRYGTKIACGGVGPLLACSWK